MLYFILAILFLVIFIWLEKISSKIYILEKEIKEMTPAPRKQASTTQGLTATSAPSAANVQSHAAPQQPAAASSVSEEKITSLQMLITPQSEGEHSSGATAQPVSQAATSEARPQSLGQAEAVHPAQSMAARVGTTPNSSVPSTSAHSQTAQSAVTQPHSGANTPSILDWQNFTTAKLFSWVGGFILFLGVAFWIKYSIENNLISPVMRIVSSLILGALLLGGGLLIRSKKLKTTSDTLCGVGLTIMYIAVFAAHTFYQLIGPVAAFSAMVLIALASFGVAIWREAKYIGFLAEIISFLTPFLLGINNNSLIFFFIYVACINLAAGATALVRKWDSLLIGSLIFTFLCQVITIWNFELLEHNLVFCVFSALYTGAAALASWKYSGRLRLFSRNFIHNFIAANLFFVLTAFATQQSTYHATLPFLALALWLNGCLVYLTAKDKELSAIAWHIGKSLIFLSLMMWTYHFQKEVSSVILFLSFLAFVAINGGADLFFYKRQNKQPGCWSWLFPMLLMLPIFVKLPLVNTGEFILSTLLLVLLMGGATIFSFLLGKTIPIWIASILFLGALIYTDSDQILSGFYTPLVLAFSFLPILLVFGVSKWNAFKATASAATTVLVSALMPYLLIFCVIDNIPQDWLTAIGFTLLLNMLCLFFAYVYRNGKILPWALMGNTLVLLEAFPQVLPKSALWFCGGIILTNILFTATPFAFKRRFLNDKSAWAAAALAGVTSNWILQKTLEQFYGLDNGLLAAIFAVLFCTSTYFVYCWQNIDEGIQRTRLAWLGGVSLLFITEFFPLQFNLPVTKVAWALEGAALVWLNRKIQHRGLSVIGFILLALVFFLLLFATKYVVPAGTGNSIFNTYLYTFGIGGAAMLLAAKLLKTGDSLIPWLKLGGGFILFALLNIEIAVYFSAQLGILKFDMFGAFNAAIAYTIAWTLFGSICIFLGGNNKKSFITPVGLGLVALSLLKLFLSDIWALGGMYRIVGLFGIAIVLISVSFIFQAMYKKS